MPSNGRSKLRLLCALLLLGVMVGTLGSETMTLTTYYPSPSGIYRRLVSTAEAVFARDGGNVGVGTSAPSEKLDVNGNSRVRGTLTLQKFDAEPYACTGAKDGAIALTKRYMTCVCRPGKGWVSTKDGNAACAWSGTVVTLFDTRGNPGNCGYSTTAEYCMIGATDTSYPMGSNCFSSVSIIGHCTCGVDCPSWAVPSGDSCGGSGPTWVGPPACLN
ncbi:MAG: hypothetical protein HY078_12415 [Elusimicrobia bacterium]|nr:hypothetical protein [Elusimicrobiota bacterium]